LALELNKNIIAPAFLYEYRAQADKKNKGGKAALSLAM